jgi:hypothetical protein
VRQVDLLETPLWQFLPGLTPFPRSDVAGPRGLKQSREDAKSVQNVHISSISSLQSQTRCHAPGLEKCAGGKGWWRCRDVRFAGRNEAFGRSMEEGTTARIGLIGEIEITGTTPTF